MNHKRKGHRGRHKKNTQDNQAVRVAGNSVSKQLYRGGSYKKLHLAPTKRNTAAPEEWQD